MESNAFEKSMKTAAATSPRSMKDLILSVRHAVAMLVDRAARKPNREGVSKLNFKVAGKTGLNKFF